MVGLKWTARNHLIRLKINGHRNEIKTIQKWTSKSGHSDIGDLWLVPISKLWWHFPYVGYMWINQHHYLTPKCDVGESPMATDFEKWKRSPTEWFSHNQPVESKFISILTLIEKTRTSTWFDFQMGFNNRTSITVVFILMLTSSLDCK